MARHLRRGSGVGPRRLADEHTLPDRQYVAAIHRGRRLDLRDRPIASERTRHGRRFRPPRGSAWPRDNGHLVEHYGGVLDEHRVRHVAVRGETLDEAPGVPQPRLVRSVLALRRWEIDRLTREVRELASHD